MVIVALLVFSRPVSHFLDTAALMVAVAVATGVAAVAAALVFAAFLSTRRRRAVAGGCVNCQFRCQHAMTEPSRRLWLVSTADRGVPGPAHPQPAPVPGRAAAAHGHPAATAGRPGPVFLPISPAGTAGIAKAASCGGVAGPRWPDRPAHRERSPA